jgi:tRNA G10  N-methylase Trm11
MARTKKTVLFPRGNFEVCHKMELNESFDQEEECQWYEQCGKLVEKIGGYKASIELLSENNDEQIQQFNFNQSLKLLKTELEFEEQKLRMLTNSDGVFYEASLNQSETKTYNFGKCGEGKDITKREM